MAPKTPVTSGFSAAPRAGAGAVGRHTPLALAGAFLLCALAFAEPPERRLVGPADQAGPGIDYPIDMGKLGLVMPSILDDSKIDRVLRDPRTVYYKLPQAYQQWVPGRRVEHKDVTLGTSYFTSTAPVWGVYKTSFRPQLNANPDFPWEVTVGLNLAHRAKLTPTVYDTVNFLSLPEDEDGRLIPVLVLADERPVKWLFPPGTVVGEVIYTNFQGRKYVQEVRTRKKSGDSTKWFPGAFRPVGSREEFQRLTQTAYEPQRRFMSFRNPEEDEVFKVEGTVERLPGIEPELVKQLLSRPFRDVTANNWAPAPDQEFSILPKDYSFGLFPHLDAETCAGCHRQTQISARNLTPREKNIQENPLHVGNIRGCDAVFTWHPFWQFSVLDDDSARPGREIYLRPFDARNGIVALARKGQAPSREYKLTEYVEKSLAPYELPEAPYLHDPSRLNGLLSIPLRDNRLVTFAPSSVTVRFSQPVQQQYRWEFRSRLDPQRFLRGVLVRESDGAVVGAWSPELGQFISAADQRPVVPPVAVPQWIKEVR